MYSMKTKITKKSLSVINKTVVEPYFHIYDSLQQGMKDNLYRVSDETFTSDEAKRWQFSKQFMPEEVQKVIRKEHLRCFSIDIGFENHITFSVRWFVRTDKKLSNELLDKLLRALSSMIVMSRYGNCNLKNKKIVLRMFDTNIKKCFPAVGQTIGPEHVNSAYTVPCKYSTSSELEIVIFREEEWQKVLFHELMHTYSLDIGLDTSFIKRSLSEIFDGLDCKFNLTEAYCEFWARTIWTIVNSPDSYEKQLGLLAKQQEWAIRQAANVLLRMPQNPKSCYERTSAFSYYVITALLLSAFPSTIEWCERNCEHLLAFPDTQQGVKSFLQLIDNIVKSETIRAKWDTYLKLSGNKIASMEPVTSKMSYV